MLSYCRQANLKVELKDALQALKDLPDSSQIAVSGFHLAEHIPFEDLQTLVKESFRVLKPAGLLILETPNPENIVVGSANFYLDPSHLKPLPPPLLAFLPQYYNFPRVKILRLQETIDLKSSQKIGLHEILGGISPDYAIIAQKDADPVSLKLVSHAFDQEYGVTLSQAIELYQTQEDLTLAHLEASFQECIDKFDALSQRVFVIERILTPFIWTYHQLHLVRNQGIAARFRAATRKSLKLTFHATNNTLKRFPRLYLFCLKIAYAIKLDALKRYLSESLNQQNGDNKTTQAQALLNQLPTGAQEIYRQINAALIEKDKA
jgi:O-antigen chain-terminating methyltransferase